MFFKRIEMTGFKSFATKTVVEFKPGVTIVVGPNGCGKSNIFDAIRWVLGEHRAKSLRGTKMGDVIFQGSATYRPMGCAQVTLVIDNEDGRLPLAFSEISITRRLYRSGESEYLINKAPCLLRDIHELFLDTGIGTDSYSVMEQAKANHIVQCRPEDRRQLFEEAAGISKYRERKVQALRKLERTEQDLVRLEDHIRTCRTLRNSLKRQATKAERYNELRQAAREADMKVLTIDARRVRRDLAEAEKRFQGAEDRLGAARARNDRLQARREELQLRIEQGDDLLQDLSLQHEDQRVYIQRCEQDILRLQMNAENERRRGREILDQIKTLRVEIDEFGENLADARIEEARLAVQLIRLRSRQQVRRAEHERLRADSDATLRKIRETRQAIEEAAGRMMELRNERNRLEIGIEQAQAALDECQADRTRRAEAIASLDAQVAERQDQLEARRREMAESETQWGSLKEQARVEREARETLIGEHRRAERELTGARSRLEALERLAHDYEGYYAGVKAVMLASESGRLGGVIGAVPELIQPIESDNDLAIEVALGNHVQDIVVRTGDDGKACLAFLKEERAGRATLLPIDLIDGRPPSDALRAILHRPGVVGLASDLVTYDAYIERAVLYLLGRTIVTDNVDVALALTRQGERHRYVTLDGQLVSPAGAMTGGSRNQSPLMARQREITELTTTTFELTEREADLAARILKRERHLADLETRGAQLRESIQELRLDLGRRETELANLRKDAEQERKGLDSIGEREETSRGEVQSRRKRLAEADARIEELESHTSALCDARETMEGAIYGSREEVDRLAREVAEADQEIVRREEQRARQSEIAESSARELQTRRGRLTALVNERRRAYDEARNYLEQRRRVRRERRALVREVEGLASRRERIAGIKETTVQELHGLDRDIQAAGKELNVASNEHSEIHADLVNARERIRHMEERARDHLDATLEEVVAQVGRDGEIEESREDLDRERTRLQREIRRMGDNINMRALVEYKEEDERYQFLSGQQTDLIEARDSLKETIDTIDKTTRELFWEAFEQIRQNFIEVYRTLFAGGKADLTLQELEEGDPLLDGGIEIAAQPPGKKLQNISLLSGGEQALTAVSLMFAIFLYKPSPFCVLDEIDAPLDDANVGRFREMLREFSERTQFIIITHNKITMELADTLYGITMQETGVSSLVSVSFDQAERMAEAAS